MIETMKMALGRTVIKRAWAMLSSLMLVFLFLLSGTSLLVAAPSLQKKDGRYVIKDKGRVFPIRGVTYSNRFDASSIDDDMKRLKSLGVNIIRTWGTGDDSKLLFDAAHRQGIKVMAGIWMRHGRPGAEGDDFFNWQSDQQGIQAQWDGAIKTVKQYKDHPAILFWGVGNEVFLNIGTEQEKVAYAKFLGRLCKKIKSIDPDHLITSSCAWTMGAPYWEKYCPDIDVYGVNSYGAGVGALEDAFQSMGVSKPYVLTEFGPRGEWDAPSDKNGLKKEPSDEEKWQAHTEGWQAWIADKKQCLGGFVFNYGNAAGYNHAEIWLNLMVQNAYRPQYWGTYQSFTGKKPPNAFPKIKTFALDRDLGKEGEWLKLQLKLLDEDSQHFDIKFYYNQRLEGAPRHKRDAVMALDHKGSLSQGFQIQLPRERGLIKVYAFVKDDTNNLAIAHQSCVIVAENESLSVGKAGRQAQLPFYVYKDEGSAVNHYGATGFMGSDLSKLKVDHDHRKNPQAGSSCMLVHYQADGGWYGLSWQDPFGDWGEQYGGYDLRGAKALSFWARSDNEGVKLKFGIGMFNRGKSPWFDTGFADTGEVLLNKTWTRYELDVSHLDLTRIKTGFYFFGAGMGQAYRFYIDEVVFQ